MMIPHDKRTTLRSLKANERMDFSTDKNLYKKPLPWSYGETSVQL